jgi:ribonuclease VapC
MFMDASVVVAILGREPGYEEIVKRLASAEGTLYISPLVKFEASMALARLKAMAVKSKRKPSSALLRQAMAAVDVLVEDVAAEEVSISPAIGKAAIEASIAYGKTIGHRADLNFGDCFSYACAKTLKVTLLYKGNDFAHTDLA